MAKTGPMENIFPHQKLIMKYSIKQRMILKNVKVLLIEIRDCEIQSLSSQPISVVSFTEIL